MADFLSAEYSWKDITITLLGRPLVRVMEIEYTVEVDKKHIYGRGSKPVGIQVGNEKTTGNLTIGQSELEALIQKAAQTKPGAKLTDLVFDINVSYLQGAKVVNDRIVGCMVTQTAKSMKQGDTDMEVKLPFLAIDVQYNIQ